MRRPPTFPVFLLFLFLAHCGGSGNDSGNSGGNPAGNNGGGSGGGNLATCQIFPSDNPWNLNISSYEVHENSDEYMASMNAGSEFLHPDFGSNPDYGIPYITVGGDEPQLPVSFVEEDESDPGPYPIPADAPVEVGDQHVLAVDIDNCLLYEIYDAAYIGPGWEAYSGAVFDLSSNALRPEGWTSADAAGLPILPGLVRHDEAVELGEIRHALRFTANVTQEAYIHPATHEAGSTTDPGAPPMGLRVRLRADYDITGFTGASRVVLEALKTYGLILADNGSDWFITGARDPRWDDEDLEQLKTVPASAFEAVETGPLHY
ncbi:MAG TPA: hypothetical protein VFW62_04310 [bacterium]|nr:hypothetical protein [bacterium]